MIQGLLDGVRTARSSCRRLRQAAQFELAWQAHASRVRRTGGRIDLGPPQRPGSRGPFVTTVLWLPPDVALAARAAAAGLRDRWPEHFHYPADRMHITVVDLSHRLAVASEPDSTVAELGEAISAQGPIEITLRGLGLSPSTVYAQAFAGEGLDALRRRLGAPSPGVRQLARAPLAGAAFANVVRFRTPASSELVREVARHRCQRIGTFTAAEVELLRTDKIGTPSATTTIARWSLCGSPVGTRRSQGPRAKEGGA